jgi:hypothetical protein
MVHGCASCDGRRITYIFLTVIFFFRPENALLAEEEEEPVQCNQGDPAEDGVEAGQSSDEEMCVVLCVHVFTPVGCFVHYVKEALLNFFPTVGYKKNQNYAFFIVSMRWQAAVEAYSGTLARANPSTFIDFIDGALCGGRDACTRLGTAAITFFLI